jgi:hypothetical protein
VQAASTTSAIDHTLLAMISNGVTGITSKCSMAMLPLLDERRPGEDDR